MWSQSNSACFPVIKYKTEWRKAHKQAAAEDLAEHPKRGNTAFSDVHGLLTSDSHRLQRNFIHPKPLKCGSTYKNGSESLQFNHTMFHFKLTVVVYRGKKKIVSLLKYFLNLTALCSAFCAILLHIFFLIVYISRLLFLPAVLSFIFYSCIVGIEQPQFCSTCITNKELFFSILFCSNLSCFSDSTSIIPYYIKRLVKVPLIKPKYITDKLNKDTNK